MRHCALLLSYDGTDFHGSQIQRGVRTVQGELEEALRQVTRQNTRLAFAGRTDRGVHARGQVATGDIAWERSCDALRDALNATTPDDIVVARVWEAPSALHARFSATAREYRYTVHVGPVPPALERRYVWWRTAPVDAEAAQVACAVLRGTHAFGSFAGSGRSQTESAAQLTRTVLACEWSAQMLAADATRSGEVEQRHTLRVVANGFLPQMARNMVAAVCQVGQGSRSLEWLRELLAANDRRLLGEAAPPQGLVFWKAYYGTPSDDTIQQRSG